MDISWSRIIGILAALGAAIAAIAMYLDQIDPRFGIAALIASTFIAVFTERIQGGLSKAE